MNLPTLPKPDTVGQTGGQTMNGGTQQAQANHRVNHMDEIQDEVWITRDGQAIEVRDMEEQHVRNALRMALNKWQAGLSDEEARDALRDLIQKRDEERELLEDPWHDVPG